MVPAKSIASFKGMQPVLHQFLLICTWNRLHYIKPQLKQPHSQMQTHLTYGTLHLTPIDNGGNPVPRFKQRARR